MQHSMKRLVVVAVLGILIFGNTLGCSMFKAKDEAEKVSQKLFEDIKNRDYDKALKLYSAKFFNDQEPDEWKNTLIIIYNKLGDLKDYQLQGWRVNSNMAGTFVLLAYEVKYQKYPATESLTLQKEGNSFRIIGHNINSEGFLKE